jgi:dipeptidyl aminopeptidase/acylaminoacyl peptidase
MNARSTAFLACLLLAALPTVASAADGVDVDAFLRKDRFEELVISPDGTYLAATVPGEDRTGLRVIRRADGVITTGFEVGKERHVFDITWVSDKRLLFRIAPRGGSRDSLVYPGDLFGVDADGGRAGILVGLFGARPETGTNIGPKRTEWITDAELVDDLPADEKYVVVAVEQLGNDPYARAERMDVDTGRRTTLARVPVPRARFTTDAQGVVRFAKGHASDNYSKLYYRSGEEGEWTLVNDESASGRVETALGFSRDGKVAYLQRDHAEGPDSIVAFDVATQARTEVLRDADVDPAEILRAPGARAVPVGVRYLHGTARTVFFDPASADARIQRGLEAAFPGQGVRVTSTTKDGRLLLLEVSGPRNPGDFYIYDTTTKKADHVVSRREWFDPDAMAEVRPVRIDSRDGLALHGYLTLPKGSDGRNLPAVVMPHGGPFGLFDEPEFDDDAQILAQAGYAVLQVNFRGSGNYGRRFHQAGAREWGGKMQDDVTDATRWLVEQGIADGKRVCIHGASYGAYAALMGAVREPDLYRCASGLIGVYHLPRLAERADASSDSTQTWAREWVGEGDALEAISPTMLASRIKVPVLLSAGGSDRVAPFDHSKKMEAALRKAGVPVETLFYPNEGHGYYYEKNRREYYETLLAFLSRHLGGATAAPRAAKDKKDKDD